MSNPKTVVCAVSLLVVVGSLASCETTAMQAGGRPEALAPILGPRGLGRPVPRSRANEPVEDYWVDLVALAAAWPEARVELPRLIQAVIARGSWIDEHHVAEATDGAVHVRHRPDVIAQVRRLVEGLRGRLLAPLQIHVVFAEVGRDALDKLAPFDRARAGERRWETPAFRAALSRGEARVLARTILTGFNGQWAVADRVSNQAYLIGLNVVDGAVSPRSITLASGFTIQAAAWRWGEDRAVVAVAGLFTGEAVGSQSLSQTVHRALPRKRKNEQDWESHDVKLDLPVRDFLEFRNQLTVARGDWTLAAVLPRDRKRLCAALIRVDWRSPVPALPQVAPLSRRGYSLEMIPIALPTEAAAAVVETGVEFDNRRDISANAVGWFKTRAKVYQESQKKSTINFSDSNVSLEAAINPQAASYSSSKFGKRGGTNGSSPAGLMPEPLEKLKDAVLQAEWPDGTALEFVANHLFVVHTSEMTGYVRSLIEQTHVWRNRRILVDVAFPVLTSSTADDLQATALSAERASALRRGDTQLPAAYLLGRGGSHAEIFVGEMHALLSDAWPPDRSSPPVQVYWRGARLAVEPQLGASSTQTLNLTWQQHRLERLAASEVAAAILQQPQDSIWRHQQQLQLAPGQNALTGLSSDAGKLQALLISARAR